MIEIEIVCCANGCGGRRDDTRHLNWLAEQLGDSQASERESSANVLINRKVQDAHTGGKVGYVIWEIRLGNMGKS